MTDHPPESVVVIPGDDILDDLFHGCAFAAFIDQAVVEQAWPNPDATRRRAYQYFEEALAEKNRRKNR